MYALFADVTNIVRHEFRRISTIYSKKSVSFETNDFFFSVYMRTRINQKLWLIRIRLCVFANTLISSAQMYSRRLYSGPDRPASSSFVQYHKDAYVFRR